MSPTSCKSEKGTRLFREEALSQRSPPSWAIWHLCSPLPGGEPPLQAAWVEGWGSCCLVAEPSVGPGLKAAGQQEESLLLKGAEVGPPSLVTPWQLSLDQ